MPDEERVANVALVVCEREGTVFLQIQVFRVVAFVVHHVRVFVCDDVEVETIHAVIGGDLVLVFVHGKDKSVATKSLHDAANDNSHAVIEHHHAPSALDVGHREHVGERIETEVTTWRDDRETTLS